MGRAYDQVVIWLDMTEAHLANAKRDLTLLRRRLRALAKKLEPKR